MTGQPAVGFAGLLRQLRAEARLTQEELAEAASLSPRSVSDLERGINRTARKDTAELLAAALGLAEPVSELFVAAARGRGPAAEVLAALHGDAAWPGCPYLGLVPFEEKDARVFFGRRELVDQLVRRLAARPGAPGILLVTGESGAGKSSLLRAGLLPRLAAGALGPGSQRWPRRVMRPGGSPLRELAMQLADISGTDPVSVYQSLSAAPGEAAMLAEQAVRAAAGRTAAAEPDGPDKPAGAARLILVIDQFEELFAADAETDAGRAEREAFIAALDAAATIPAGPRQLPPALVVAAVRADFLGRLIGYPPLKAALDAGPFTVGPISEAELRLAITGPAAEAGLAVEPALADAVIAELLAGGGGRLGGGVLPLMSQAMAATWEHREGSELTLRAYRRAGGVADAVDQSAQAAYDDLTSRQRDAARLIFTQLATVNADGLLARRRCGRADLRSTAAEAGAETAADSDAVIDVFSARRLLVLGEGDVEISHDVLLQSWKRLRDWLSDDQVDRARYGQVVSDADAWQASGRDPAYLYRPGRLAAVDAAASRWREAPDRYLPLPATAQAFLGAARHAARRGGRRRTAVIVVLSVLLALAVAGGGTALGFQRQAEGQRDAALAQLVAAEANLLRPTDPNLATQLSIAAYQVDPAAGTDALLASQGSPGVLDDGEPALDMAQLNGGSMLAVSTGTAIRLLNAVGGQLRGQIGGLATGPVATVPGALLLVAATGQLGSVYPLTANSSQSGHLDQIRVWSIADPARPRLLAAVSARATDVTALAVSPDGRTLAVASTDGAIRIWDIADPSRPELLATLPGDGKAVYSLAFDPRGGVLASTGDDHMIRLWDLSDPAHPAPLSRLSASTATPESNDPAMLHRVAFSADGTYLAGVTKSSFEEQPEVWNVANPRAPRKYAAANSSDCEQVMGLAFAPTGDTLLSSCADWPGPPSTLDVWQFPPAPTANAGELEHVTSLPTASGGTGIGGQVLVEPGRNIALNVSLAGVTEWDLRDLAEPGALASALAATGLAPGNLALNSSGRPFLADTADLGSIRLWTLHGDSGSPSVAAVYPEAIAQATTGAEVDAVALGVALSGNGSVLAASEVDDNRPVVALYRTAKPGSAPVATIRPSDGAISLALSGTGNLLAVSDNADYQPDVTRPPTVRLYDLRNLARPRLIATLPADTYQVLFSPDGRLLVAFTANALLSWDIADPSRPVELPEHYLSQGSLVAEGAFSPDGTLLAAEDSTGVLWLWHVTRDRLAGQAFLQNQGTGVSGTAVAFSPDGRTLVAAGQLASSTSDSDSDPAIDLWDVGGPGGPKLEAQWAEPNGDAVDALGFSPGQVLVVEGQDDVNLWSTNPAQIVKGLCARVGDTITPAQWQEYVPGLPYRPPCDRAAAG